MTLRDVQARSKGTFKPSVVGGYERGERAISVERFCALASIYGCSPDRLLGEALAESDPLGRQPLVIDLTRLELIPKAERERIAEYAHNIRTRRRDYVTDVITLRSGDLDELAMAEGISPGDLLAALEHTLRQGDET